MSDIDKKEVALSDDAMGALWDELVADTPTGANHNGEGGATLHVENGQFVARAMVYEKEVVKIMSREELNRVFHSLGYGIDALLGKSTDAN